MKLLKTSMKQQELPELLGDKENELYRPLLKIHGQVAAEEFIKKTINRWKSENFRLAVAGRPATGKSSFINAMRYVDPNTYIAVESDYSNKAEIHVNYQYLVGKQIVCEELQYEMDQCNMRLCDYDYFLIFFDNVIHEEDFCIIKQLQEIRKPYRLIRSKIDVDFDNGKYDGYETTDIVPNILVKIYEDLMLSKYPILWNSKSVFLISSRDKSLGDMTLLKDFMMSKLQFEVIMNRLNVVSRAIMKTKNKRRIIRISLSTAAAAAVWVFVFYTTRSIPVVCSIIPPIITGIVVNRFLISFLHDVTDNTLILRNIISKIGIV